jgi:hypothetical protein
MLTYEVKETMRENAKALVESMILDRVPFRLVLWNNDNWNMPLPDEIMTSFPTQIVLDIKEQSLDDSFVDENTGEIIISTVFLTKEFHKVVEYDEIIAVLDFTGQPYILNNFKMEEKITLEQVVQENFLPQTKTEVIEMVMSEGIPVESAQRSINAFIKNNPDIAERLGEGGK